MSYAIEDTDLDQMDKLIDYYRDIGSDNDLKTVWSMWATEQWQNMNDVSGIPTGTVIRYDGGWGKDTTAEVQGETWLDVWKACNSAILQSGDHHHIFIEQLVRGGLEQRADGTVQEFFDLFTGS